MAVDETADQALARVVGRFGSSGRAARTSTGSASGFSAPLAWLTLCLTVAPQPIGGRIDVEACILFGAVFSTEHLPK